MVNMKKPSKKEINASIVGTVKQCYQNEGYNQACDDWEAWLQSMERIRPIDLEEIKSIEHEEIDRWMDRCLREINRVAEEINCIVTERCTPQFGIPYSPGDKNIDDKLAAIIEELCHCLLNFENSAHKENIVEAFREKIKEVFNASLQES